MKIIETKNIKQNSAPGERREVIEGRRLVALAKRWHSVNGYNLVKRGIMPVYMNRYKAEKYCVENLRFKEFHSTKKNTK
jgi:hypothetical protein